MKLATILLGILLLGSLVPLSAGGPAGAGQVAMAFTGGSVWNADGVSGTCKWYIPLLGGLGVTAPTDGIAVIPPVLFSDPSNPTNSTAYLVWVSDFKIVNLYNPPWTLFLGAAGTATIYYSATPSLAYWNDPASLGQPVATFVRNAGMGQSADNFASDTFTFTADLTWSKNLPVEWETVQLQEPDTARNDMPGDGDELYVRGSRHLHGNAVAVGPSHKCGSRRALASTSIPRGQIRSGRYG